MDKTPQLYRQILLTSWTPTTLTRIQTHPSESTYQDTVGRTPLHLALFKRAPLDIFTSLLSANPDAVVTEDVNGRIPLHYACMYGASIEIIHAILNVKEIEEVMEKTDHDGWNALHFACYCKTTNLSTIKLLLRTCPTLAMQSEKCQRTPLHFSILYHCSPSVVQEILQYGGGATDCFIRMVDKRKRSALHVACAQYDFSSEAVMVLQLLVDASIGTIMECDGHGLNCLDILEGICVQRRWDKMLFERGCHPKDLAFEIYWRKVTLLIKSLYLKRNSHQKEKIETNEKETAAKTKEKQSFHMVHETLKLKGCPNTIRQIALQKHSNEIFIPDEDGNLPLHLAAKSEFGSNNNNEESIKIINTLLTTYPDAAKITNNDNQEPLHLALKSGKTWKQGLIDIFRVNPSSICGVDIDLKLIPFVLELVSRLTTTMGVEVRGGLYLVLREMPDIIVGESI